MPLNTSAASCFHDGFHHPPSRRRAALKQHGRLCAASLVCWWFASGQRIASMAVGKNKRMSKGKKGGKKKA